MEKKTSNNEILEAINVFANNVEKRFQHIEQDLSDVKKDLTTVQSQMVTKDYLDDKMADLRGDLVVMMRKEDTKLATLVDILTERKVISKDDVKRILDPSCIY